MNDDDVKKQIKQMCDFILQEAREKANEIKVKTEEEYQIDLANQTQSGKAKVREEYALKEKGLDVQKRIAQSIEISKQNARKLGVREQLLNDLLQTTKEKLNKKLSLKMEALPRLTKCCPMKTKRYSKPKWA